MTRVHALASAALVVWLAEAAAASPTTIGAFFDVEATDCDASVVPFSPFNVYVSAVLGTDAGEAGITGAEFRVAGLAGIVLSFTPNPAASLSLGDPTGQACNIAFPTCVTTTAPRPAVLLYTITCSSGQPVSPRTVTVRYPLTVFSDPPWCPSVILCDAPTFTRLCVSGGQAFVNMGSCAVSVRPTAWSTVKSLFTANSAFHAPVTGAGRR